MSQVQDPNSDPSTLIPPFIQALQEELQSQMDWGRRPSIGVYHGRWLRHAYDQHIYQFRLDEAVKEVSDCLLEFSANDCVVRGRLVAAKGLSIHVAFSQYLGEKLPRGQVSFNSDFLWARLLEIFQGMRQEPHGFDLHLANHVFSALSTKEKLAHQDVYDANLDLRKDQLFKRVLGNKRLLIWGPAGTGKTQILAEVLSFLLSQKERVLLTAHTHNAVNQGLDRFLSLSDRQSLPLEFYSMLRFAFNDDEKGQFDTIRTGLSEEAWIRSRYEKIWDKTVALSMAIKSSRDQLGLCSHTSFHGSQNARSVQKKLMELESQLKKVNEVSLNLIVNDIAKLDLLATTLAQLVLKPQLRRYHFDTVIIDEASMSSLPIIYLAASLARKRVILIGDFCQLPPIAIGKSEQAKKWLVEDIFSHVGVPRVLSEKANIKDLVVLRKQRRMHETISEVSNQVFYHGVVRSEVEPNSLTCDAGSKALGIHTSSIPPVVLYDSSQCIPWCTRRNKGEGRSRINLFHALAVVQLIEQLYLNYKHAIRRGLGVLTPYREQAKLIQLLIEDHGLDCLHQGKPFVDVATVHQFQGEERDVIIWDTVDAAGLPISPLLKGDITSVAGKLINVSLTRAREHLFVIADRRFLKQSLARNAALRKVLSHLESNKLPAIDARSLVPPQADFYNLFERDLQQAQKTLVLSIPLLFSNFDQRMLSNLLSLQKRGVKIFVDTLKNDTQRAFLRDGFLGLPDFLKRDDVTILCNEFAPYKEMTHANLVIIDDQVCWHANENFFQAQPKNLQCFRMNGSKAIAEINAFFELNYLKSLPAVKQGCALCGGMLGLMWNRRQYRSASQFYVGCIDGCGYKRPLLRGEQMQSTKSAEKPKTQMVIPGFQDPKRESISHQSIKLEVSKNLTCQSCGSQTRVRFNPGRYLFMGCNNYPECTHTTPYETDCPDCGNVLVVKRSRHGIFLGCLAYPQCRHTRNLAVKL